jgi:hypothetical protein
MTGPIEAIFYELAVQRAELRHQAAKIAKLNSALQKLERITTMQCDVLEILTKIVHFRQQSRAIDRALEDVMAREPERKAVN